jgi:hypothetical protein
MLLQPLALTQHHTAPPYGPTLAVPALLKTQTVAGSAGPEEAGLKPKSLEQCAFKVNAATRTALHI